MKVSWELSDIKPGLIVKVHNDVLMLCFFTTKNPIYQLNAHVFSLVNLKTGGISHSGMNTQRVIEWLEENNAVPNLFDQSVHSIDPGFYKT